MSALTPEFFTELATIPTSNLSDAMDNLGYSRGIVRGLSPLDLRQPAFAGPAVTVRQMQRHPSEKEAHLTRHGNTVSELAQPGDVVLIDVDGRMDVCTLGALISLTGKLRGLAGFVVDGCVRDVREIVEMGFPIHCRGASPVRSTPDLQTVSVNETVTIGGVQVRAGDIIVADDTGVIAIPPDLVEEIHAAAKEIRHKEIAAEQSIRDRYKK